MVRDPQEGWKSSSGIGGTRRGEFGPLAGSDSFGRIKELDVAASCVLDNPLSLHMLSLDEVDSFSGGSSKASICTIDAARYSTRRIGDIC
jgi:hypothetical protein